MNIMEMSRASFLLRLQQEQLRVGRKAWIMYHVGLLIYDRTKDRKLNAMANEVYAQYLQGTVCLVQRRMGDNAYEYYAIPTDDARR